MVQVKAFIAREKDGTYSIFVDDKAPINYGLVGEGNTVEAELCRRWYAFRRSSVYVCL